MLEILKYPHWQGIGAIFTLLGFVVVCIQLYQASRLNRTDFENSLTKEYRDIIKVIPLEALLDQNLIINEKTELMSFYRYLDLSNEQVFLMMKNKISKETWYEWQEGIKSNLSKDSFKEAFRLINKANSKSFDELKYFIYCDGNIKLEFCDTFDSSCHYSRFATFKKPNNDKDGIKLINNKINNGESLFKVE